MQRPPVARDAGGRTVRLRFVGRDPIFVRGATTGRQYQFSSLRAIHAVDVADATAMLRTGLFRRA